MEEFLKNIDFKMLRDQKTNLINVQAKIEKLDRFTQEEWDSLEGILCLIDTIQEEVVNKYGYTENEVFNLSNEEDL